ncbi:MAG: hypothetical protein MI723_07625 [Caulobacterales bacterium]|nr:hypothetical protein [Caulobacterales bacterium]
MKRLDDIIRVEFDFDHPEQAASHPGGRRSLSDKIVSFCEPLCDRRDVVAIDQGALWVFLHPGCEGRDPADFRVTLLAKLSAYLSGTTTIPVSSVVLDAPSLEELQHLAAVSDEDAAREARQAERERQEGRAPTPLASYELPAKSAPASDPSFAQCSAVTCRGAKAVYLQPLNIHEFALHQDESYFEPSAELFNFDLYALSRSALQVIDDLKAGRHLLHFFPLNINNLRKSEMRERFFFEVRQIPEPILNRIHPALVRVRDGMPPNIYYEQIGYCRSVFPAVWLYAGYHDRPIGFRWGPPGTGVLLAGLERFRRDQLPLVLHSWKRAAAKRSSDVVAVRAAGDSEVCFSAAAAAAADAGEDAGE